MGGDQFRAVLEGWVNQKVKVINPASYRKGTITEGIALETYEATIAAVGVDFVHITFDAQKKDRREKVDQYVPLTEVKRVSVWGEEKYLQL